MMLWCNVGFLVRITTWWRRGEVKLTLFIQPLLAFEPVRALMLNPMEEVHEITAQQNKKAQVQCHFDFASKRPWRPSRIVLIIFFALSPSSLLRALKREMEIVKKANTTRPQSLAIEGNYEIHSNNWNNVLVVFRLHPRSPLFFRFQSENAGHKLLLRHSSANCMRWYAVERRSRS